jgi:carboxypeptidase C (cathepsin A)
LGNTIA